MADVCHYTYILLKQNSQSKCFPYFSTPYENRLAFIKYLFFYVYELQCEKCVNYNKTD